MRVKTSSILILGSAAALAACGGSSEDTAMPAVTAKEAPAETSATPANMPAQAPANGSGSMFAQDAPDSAAAARSPCPPEPGVACSGPLVVRTENVALTADQRTATVRGTLVVENRTDEPVKFAFLDERIVLNLENGASVASRSGTGRGLSGMEVCRRDGLECLQTTPGVFKTLTPDDSPARVNFELSGQVENSLLPSLPSARTGTATMELYVVGSAGNGERVQIALPNVPVRNQLAN